MTTTPAFNAAADTYNRRFGLLFAVLLVAGIGFVLLFIPVFDSLAKVLKPHVGDDSGKALVAGTMIVLMLVTFGLLGWRFERWTEANPAGRCPNCGRWTARPGLRWKAVATRSCPHCERRFLGEPEPPSPSTAFRTTAEIATGLAEVKRLVVRQAVWLCVPFLAWFALFIVLMTGVGRAAVIAWFDRRVGQPWGEAAFLCVVLGVLTVAWGWGLVRFLAIGRKRTRVPQLRCPHCGKPMPTLALRQTGNCGWCGRRAIVGRPPVGAAGPPPTG